MASSAQTSRSKKPLGTYIETRGFRPEIQGLRALAVLLVVMYHVWFGKVSGGVDVFLLVSAFLLSLSSLRKINEHKPLQLVKYWAHVFQRLMPAASVAIILTLIASLLILPFSRHMGLVEDAKASLLYYQNWHLAFNAVDYYQQDATRKTPFQHFWSLSMQGQIFILWPILFASVALMVRKLRFNLMGSTALVFGTVFVASLTWSVISTNTQQTFAYFDTRARLWEFAAGTLIAMATMLWKAPKALRIIMGWVGVIGLVSAGMILPVETGFPGYMALWPILSAALVMLAGNTGSKAGVDSLLSSKPLLWIGESAYGLYLVHWPLLILYTAVANKTQAGWLDGLIIILISVALAWCLHRFIEQPLRGGKDSKARTAPPSTRRAKFEKYRTNNPWARPISTVLACLAAVGGTVTASAYAVQERADARSEYEAMAGSDMFPGALNTDPNAIYREEPIPYTVDQQRIALQGSCSSIYPGFAPNPLLENSDGERDCWAAMYGGDVDAPLTVMVGDSHAHHALPMVSEFAENQGSNLIVMLRPGCRFTIPAESFSVAGPENTPSCKEFNAEALKTIAGLRPDNVVAVSTRSSSASGDEQFVRGLDNVARQVTAAGGNFIALRDNPRFVQNMFTCYEENMLNYSGCGEPLENKLAPTNAAIAGLSGLPNIYHVDLTDSYCPDGFCPAVVGNVVVYMDDNHVSKQFAYTTAPIFRQQLLDQGWSIRESLN
ncbi:acyltransferase family protein [Rothia sp. ZJ1223]|uniref:acyltransferase family protein n=1 Tax=Rothia sp. ZJ1223 TaxID=2811098 RepID=UPI001958F965|nr:acyltransferase family protein [Rothia sp. ZJ1223]MBM7051538.1 acyltransferase family protein [Rothia sp. ZJ1223]